MNVDDEFVVDEELMLSFWVSNRACEICKLKPGNHPSCKSIKEIARWLRGDEIDGVRLIELREWASSYVGHGRWIDVVEKLDEALKVYSAAFQRGNV